MTCARLLLSLSVLALFGCGKSTPCSGSKCMDVGGTYVNTFSPMLVCPQWAFEAGPTSSMTVIQNGSAIEVDMQPSTTSPAHIFQGTLDTTGSLVANESATAPALNLPFGELSGSFVQTSGTLSFQGSLTLQTSGASPDAGAGVNCTGPYTIAAQRVGGGSVGNTLDAGNTTNPADGG